MPGHFTGSDRIIDSERRRQQAREALRRQVGIWLSRTIPPSPHHAGEAPIRPQL